MALCYYLLHTQLYINPSRIERLLWFEKVTRFKCGGVCLGVAMDHQVKDGISALHIITTWCDIARGLDVGVRPYLERRVLAARDPPQPKFDHVEFHPPPPLKNPQAHSKVSETRFSVFKLTREQLNMLKASCQEDNGQSPPYSSFEALTGSFITISLLISPTFMQLI